MTEFFGFLIKILSFIPVVNSWAIQRFGRLEVTPINDQGVNIFHKRIDKNAFFVKLQFHVKANTKLEVLDIDFKYGLGFTPLSRQIWCDNKEFDTDSNFRLKEKITLMPGEVHHVSLQTDFMPNESMKDYDAVALGFEVSYPVVKGIVKKTVKFKLMEGGALEPKATQKI